VYLHTNLKLLEATKEPNFVAAPFNSDNNVGRIKYGARPMDGTPFVHHFVGMSFVRIIRTMHTMSNTSKGVVTVDGLQNKKYPILFIAPSIFSSCNTNIHLSAAYILLIYKLIFVIHIHIILIT
jgi:hypothetical protein